MKDEMTVELVDAMERLIESVERLEGSMGERVEKITATVESNERETELLRRLEEAEARIAELSAAAMTSAGRKTVGAMVAKSEEKSGALDAALAHLSVEQRIAVKAELLRSGAIAV
ncbi:MAG: hypothetical protein PW792_17550 [Acidobacteriaceae bacterium]|nr:hypothetical protein [Acidobacteriaceae bacterium]